MNCCALKSESESLSLFPHLYLVKKAASISVSLAFGTHSCASTVNAIVGG